MTDWTTVVEIRVEMTRDVWRESIAPYREEWRTGPWRYAVNGEPVTEEDGKAALAEAKRRNALRGQA